MREVKIYLQRERVDPVMHALAEAGVEHMVLNHVRSFGASHMVAGVCFPRLTAATAPAPPPVSPRTYRPAC